MKLTINFPNLRQGREVMVPGIKGRFENGNVYEVGDQIPTDLVLGEPLGDAPIETSEEEE